MQQYTKNNPVKTVKSKDSYKLEDFQFKAKLGKDDAFGNIYLVELDPTLYQVEDLNNPLFGK